MTKCARLLRHNQTDAERLLWSKLRNRRLLGYKFRRQQPIGNFIADFVCEDMKLIVELDGGQHSEQVGSDESRTRVLESRGYAVVRFWNNELLDQTDSVLQSLTLTLSQRERELDRTP
ncbi:endonuclease domain-containing protein [Litorivivens lipolytica]|nr:endonuclease domain-containing protein [Litorivivens lipolytica]